jgi:hypothetical protein
MIPPAELSANHSVETFELTRGQENLIAKLRTLQQRDPDTFAAIRESVEEPE